MEYFEQQPGLLYVVATLLPLASFVLLLLVGAVRNYVRKMPEGSPGATVYNLLGGDRPTRGGAYVATGAVFLSFVLCLTGFVLYVSSFPAYEEKHTELHDEVRKLQKNVEPHAQPKTETEKHDHEKLDKAEEEVKALEAQWKKRWSGNIAWAGVGARDNAHQPGSLLSVGFRIDHLSAAMFLMVSFIATLIHLFSAGYMSEELEKEVADHNVHTDHGHLHRRGRFGRFFLFLSLFCFSMFNLMLADNLFQVFVSWELVGVCSYLLIGYYFERQSASNAANKAFITNRVGDAGFILGLLIVWTYVGTFNFEEIFHKIRSPQESAHGDILKNGGQFVRANPNPDDTSGTRYVVTNKGEGSLVVIFPSDLDDFHGKEPGAKFSTELKVRPLGPTDPAPGTEAASKLLTELHREAEAKRYHVMPYWLLVAAGLGIFLGCVGKSAQFPLQVWLPDAMEGPTPVSALIHAATMVAAGVYLVGRCYPLFTPETLLVIAYTGAVTLFVAASIALVMTDIKKVLAYSTVSQLGYMMLGLGVGGWAAGLFHLLTHAFFKALLFLGSGSVIYGCHHVQEMPEMGGLYRKMRVTALTMLVGVFAIAGLPLFSGWYSKDAVLAQAYGFAAVYREHLLLFLLPLATAGLTTFYMFRMWFLTFAGKPRNQEVHDHAHESPWMMTLPLVLLAIFSVCVAWGWPVWDPEASWLETQVLHHAQPQSVGVEFGRPGEGPHTVNGQAHENHALAGYLALGMVMIGFVFAALLYLYRVLDADEARAQFPGVFTFLAHKWYFDEMYSALLVRPAVVVAHWCRLFDSKVIDGAVDWLAWFVVWVTHGFGLFDKGVVDGLVNVTGNVFYRTGVWLRNVQTGYLRSYVLFLVLAAVAIWILLAALLGPSPAAVK
jgi:NADH-quinone oxidoreductase subunit L